MSKNTPAIKPSNAPQPAAGASGCIEVALTPFWLLNAGTAKKLGQHSAGILNYHVLADNNRVGLLIAVTRNEGGGYFSRERVPFRTIVACLERYKSGKPSFVSKVLKNAFISKSANNAGFLCAVLHALGLLAAAPEAKTQHIVIGNWPLWEKTMLAETGTRIELPAEIGDENQVERDAVPDNKQQKKMLEIPAKSPNNS
ncbi:hypothetical protein [Pseudoduganella umbonata]|uniref:Uncharacterized protein n=1 Tax=Pseudoduganella umbonata TaxID=864828 RepID=A0A4V1EE79_9BURK|nr:hypothetical protein [Pseudoduganella umbonata]MBB3223469.1 hypothetical protein [Pseudoduganella umbonata]QCP13641.1 hypothetical protein FCL38_26795 [Pseudoduganella umbonata]